MRSLCRCLLTAVALIAGCLLLGACGGEEEEMDLDAYFQWFEDFLADGATRMEVLGVECEQFGEGVEETWHCLDGFVVMIEESINDLNDIHPPPEARDAHDEYVAALAAHIAVWQDFWRERLADVESPSELEAVLADLGDQSALDAADERFEDACLQLQGIAAENGIEADLKCD